MRSVYLQHFFLVRLSGGKYNSRAVDEEDSTHQRDVLPDFGLTGDGRHLADFLAAQGVDDGRFSNIRVADETHADLLLVAVQLAELAQQIDQRTFTKRMGHRRTEGHGGVLGAERLDPTLGNPSRYQIHLEEAWNDARGLNYIGNDIDYLVEHEKQLLVAFFFADVSLDLLAASSQRITGVQNLYKLNI